MQIFGKKDNHVPPEGRDAIRKKLHESGVTFSFFEAAWAQRKQDNLRRLPSINLDRSLHVYIDAFIRDELSKGRYDPGLTKVCLEMLLEVFSRTLRSDLGPRAGGEIQVEDIC